ncbi:MAG: DUF2203 domain-containing protein [Pyrinomonadaceae bacterium]
MSLYTKSEADKLIPVLRPLLADIRYYVKQIRQRKTLVKRVSQTQGGGGFAGCGSYVLQIIKLRQKVTIISNMGIEIKDYDRGLIDFPAKIDGKFALLCWELNDGNEVEWWHEINAGFAGRKRI